MLKDIKSDYFDILLFSHIPEKKKLKLVKYYKNLQEKINIGISNYIHFTGKYIDYESNGKGKEYDYYDGKLQYEGEFLHGERSGKGKEYFPDGKLKFEGEYLRGERNGNGTEYYHNGIRRYICEYLNGKKMEKE